MKSHNSNESLDQAALPTPEPTPVYTLKLDTQAFMPTFNIASKSKNNTIMIISFNQLLTKVKIVQQSNNIKLKSSNELLTNVTFQVIKIFVNFNAFSIIFKRMQYNKK